MPGDASLACLPPSNTLLLLQCQSMSYHPHLFRILSQPRQRIDMHHVQLNQPRQAP